MAAVKNKYLVMAPMVVAELFSDPKLTGEAADVVMSYPLLEIKPGFWERAGRMRADLYTKRYRPKLIDTFIAQLCIDNHAALISRDRDFNAFARYQGLLLLR